MGKQSVGERKPVEATRSGDGELERMEAELAAAQGQYEQALTIVQARKEAEAKVAEVRAQRLQTIADRFANVMAEVLADDGLARALNGYNWVVGKRQDDGSWKFTIEATGSTFYKKGAVSKGGGRGKAVVVNGVEYKSASEACKKLSIEVKGDSAVRKLEAWAKEKGYTITWKEKPTT